MCFTYRALVIYLEMGLWWLLSWPIGNGVGPNFLFILTFTAAVHVAELSTMYATWTLRQRIERRRVNDVAYFVYSVLKSTRMDRSLGIRHGPVSNDYPFLTNFLGFFLVDFKLPFFIFTLFFPFSKKTHTFNTKK